MQMKRRVLTLAFIGLWLLAPTAGAQPGANTTATLIFFDGAGNQTLDPQEPQNDSSFAHTQMMAIYDALILLDAAGNPTPGLALSWAYNDAMTEFTLRLRQGVRFHDDTPFNAAAVARNFERDKALITRIGAASAETMNAITAVEVVDEFTIRLQLKEPNGQLPYYLGGTAGMMISPAAIADNAFGAALKAVGTGPYKVCAVESNLRTQMVRNDAYWAGTAGRPASFEHHYVPDGRARLNAVRSGQATFAMIDPRQIAEAKAAGLQVQINEKNSTWDIYLNVKRETIGNLKLRQAIMHAVDREAIVSALGFGASQPAVQLFASSSPMFDPALEKLFPFDQTKARKLLAETGYPNGVDINFIMLNTTEFRPLGEAIQAMLGEVGIRLKFDQLDVSQFPSFRRQQRGDMMLGRWGGRPDALQAFQTVTATGGPVNAGDAATPEIDALVAEARRMNPTDPKRVEILRRLNRLTTEQVSHIGVMTRSMVYAFRPGCITGLPPYLPTGNDRMNDVQIGAACKVGAIT